MPVEDDSLLEDNTLPRPAATGPFPVSGAAVGDSLVGPPAQLKSAGHDGRQAVDYDTDGLVRMLRPEQTTRAHRGWRAWLRLGPSRRELEERTQLEAVRAQFERPVTIMVANPKGGTGKTPVSLLLAGEFGDARGGGVVVVDNNENRGTAAFRSHFPHRRTVADLLQDAGRLERPEAQFTDLAYYLAHQISGKYYVLASDESVTRQLDEERFARVHHILSRFFAIIIIDSGNNELASNWLAALDVADGLVVPTQWRQDHLVTANKMLEKLRSRRHPVLARTIIVGTNAPEAAQSGPRKAALDWFAGKHLLPVVEIPTDRHIHEGGVLERSKMANKTQRAGLAAAAAIARLIIAAAAEPAGQTPVSTDQASLPTGQGNPLTGQGSPLTGQAKAPGMNSGDAGQAPNQAGSSSSQAKSPDAPAVVRDNPFLSNS